MRGCISPATSRAKMENAQMRPIGLVELFSRLHKRRKDETYMCPRAAKAVSDFKELKKASQGNDGEDDSGLTEAEIWVKAVGGPDKKGRVYGLKHLNLSDILSNSRAMERRTERMRRHASLLDEEMRGHVNERYSDIRKELKGMMLEERS
ncbi:uncharacterized protein LOC116192646 [Punica granatum]|uniref:Uncharacterized protein n=2 Tax=Punica granatum TaxID=22663 RepID=A0A218VSB5_PUNGR|nr:uncharacterized protein LOC116192646 [Punica granatum]OWM63395.1 hypothetical protein CDL15_Pgr022140 [Punica granatum]PKI70677.1 hypothetical protein CRG98_008910 [Punica granatum]